MKSSQHPSIEVNATQRRRPPIEGLLQPCRPINTVAYTESGANFQKRSAIENWTIYEMVKLNFSIASEKEAAPCETCKAILYPLIGSQLTDVASTSMIELPS